MSVAGNDGRSASAEIPRLDDVSVLGPHGFVRMAYADWGPIGAERTVVCVHGMSRNGRDFDVLAQRFARNGVRVVAPDLPGRGWSEWLEHSEDYATPLYLSAMSALIARLGAREVDWVGSSLGGHIGMELAALPGTPIRRLVLNDFGARIAAAALHRIAAYLRVARTFASIAEMEAYLREIHAHFGALSDAQWRHLAEHSAVATGEGRYRHHYDPAIARAFAWPLMLDITLWHVWDRVECPVLILRGEHSDLLLPGCVREMLRRGRAAVEGKVRTVDIPGCGHAPSLMADDTIGLISDFLDDDTAAPSARAARPLRRKSG
ncbi:MAG TPA: alpha/beta hydrolase [Casimicrobiaceae bacterium]